MKTKIEVYQDRNKQWRWRMIRGGRIVADSAEAYVRKASLSRSLAKLIGSFITVKFEFVVQDVVRLGLLKKTRK